MRSNIVHGRGATKNDWKRIRRWQKENKRLSPSEIDLFLHPMASVVSGQELEELLTLTVNLIGAFLSVDLLYDTIRQGNDGALDMLFLNLLLGSADENQESVIKSKSESDPERET